MKKILFFVAFAIFGSLQVFSQSEGGLISAEKAKEKPKEKEVKEEGYEMKKYWFVMLTKGEKRDHDSATAAKIQKGHIDNINRLAGLGKIMVAGPFGDDGPWRGIFIMNCKDQEEAESLLQSDPAIAAGRLSYEIHPWWTAKNEVFK